MEKRATPKASSGPGLPAASPGRGTPPNASAGRIVQKYGGSSVADADSIKRVAKRIVATRQDGHDVVVVISAMGDTTDEPMDLALQVSPLSSAPRAGHAAHGGERMSAALLAMAIHDQGLHARSLTGSQAGIITTALHGNARIIDITPGRITSALDQGDIVIVAGFQGVAQDTKDVTTLGRGASTRRRLRWRRPSAPTIARSIPTSTASTPPTRGSCPRSAHPAHQLRGDARDGGMRGQGAAFALRGVRTPGERPRARKVLVHGQGRDLGDRTRGRNRDGAGHHPRRRPRSQ